MIAVAKRGLSSGDGDFDFKAEVEWGHARQTLSVSGERELKFRGADELRLPTEEKAKEFLWPTIPPALSVALGPHDLRDVLGRARLHGPVEGLRWEGKHGPREVDIDFEVWLIKPSPTSEPAPALELSFKEKDPSDAENERQRIKAKLKQDWLLDEDVLKTEMILANH